jgi:hypothetical protein
MYAYLHKKQYNMSENFQLSKLGFCACLASAHLFGSNRLLRQAYCAHLAKHTAKAQQMCCPQTPAILEHWTLDIGYSILDIPYSLLLQDETSFSLRIRSSAHANRCPAQLHTHSSGSEHWPMGVQAGR